MSQTTETARRNELEERLLVHEEELRAHIAAKIPERFRNDIFVNDILQETWVTVFRAISDFVPAGPHGFIRWLKTVANRRILDAVRTLRGVIESALIRDADRRRTSLNQLVAALAANDKSPSRDAATREATNAVQAALKDLPRNRRLAINLRHVEGYSQKEVARQMCKTVPAINGLLYHGLRQLRERLGDGGKYLSGDHLRKDAAR